MNYTYIKSFDRGLTEGNPNKCWEWNGSKSKAGYGRVLTTWNEPYQYAHRVSWINYFGEIPKGLLILHKCDNPPCVNPHHLFLGTQKDNMQDMIKKGRNNFVKGEKHPNSKLTEKQVLEIRKLYKPKIVTMKMLAETYNVKHVTIQCIIYNKSWKHI